MKQEFKLTQLYKSSGEEFIKATCHIHNNEDDNRFECTIQGDINMKQQLWQWVNGNWNGSEGINCIVEFNDVNSVGLPIDGKIVSIDGFYVVGVK